MKKLIFSFLLLISCALLYAQPADKILTKEQLMQQPEKLGSVYLVYPGPQSVQTPAPKGFTPFYISHYGRHGSRFQSSDIRYKLMLELFESQYKDNNLTPLGEDVLERLHKLWIIARGNGGMLTSIGAEQHREIAERMYKNFPEVFSGSRKYVQARSSIVPRCKASMEAFCESLKSQDSALDITMETKPEFMAYIAYSSPEQKHLENDTTLWRGEWMKFEKESIHGERLAKTLFKDCSDIDSFQVASTLYWLAEGMQDIQTNLTLMDLFTTEELYNIWTTVNYRMYVCNADAPIANKIGVDCAKPLLTDIINKADSAINVKSTAATLRFGHDTNLMRLLSLMAIEGCDARVTDLSTLATKWQDYYLTPMGANLQIIFYKNKRNCIIVKFMHNENEVSLPIKSYNGKYYLWKNVKKYLLSKL